MALTAIFPHFPALSNRPRKAMDGLWVVRACLLALWKAEGGKGRATEGVGLQALSGFLPPPRERSQGAGDLPETEGELPVLEGCLETLGLPLESALP